MDGLSLWVDIWSRFIVLVILMPHVSAQFWRRFPRLEEISQRVIWHYWWSIWITFHLWQEYHSVKHWSRLDLIYHPIFFFLFWQCLGKTIFSKAPFLNTSIRRQKNNIWRYLSWKTGNFPQWYAIEESASHTVFETWAKSVLPKYARQCFHRGERKTMQRGRQIDDTHKFQSITWTRNCVRVL